MSTTTTTTKTAEAIKSALKFIPRRSGARGHADHGWLKTYHTFSFASYQDAAFNQYGPLRVINEDRVTPGEGFGQHSHREFEIWSYVVDGELEHRDSLGNVETMKRGDLQMTSTGTGISHSEYNRNTRKPVHFLQIWGMPHTRGLKPSYYNRHFTDEEKMNKLVKVVAPVGSEGVVDERDAKGPTPVHSNLSMHASILEPGQELSYTLNDKTKRAFLHLIMRSGYRKPSVAAGEKFEHGGAILKVNEGLLLEEGDGSFVEVNRDGDKTVNVKNVSEANAEWLLFELE